MSLPGLPVNADTRSITSTVNVLVQDYNRPDAKTPIYASDSGSATAYVIAPVPGVTQYEVGRIFCFTAANANTSRTPTLTVNGLTAGTIKRLNGTGLSPGDIPAGPVAVICTATTPTFALITPYASESVITYLGADIAIGAGTPTNAVNTGAIGGAGEKWEIEGVGCISDGGSATLGEAAIHDGANYLASESEVGGAMTWTANPRPRAEATLSGATTFTLKVQGNSAGAGVRTSGLSSLKSNTATWIRARRLA